MSQTLARPSYTAPGAPNLTGFAWVRTQLSRLAQSVPPTTVRTITTDDRVRVIDQTILVDASGANVTLTWPLVDQVAFLNIAVKKIDASANTVTILMTAPDLIDGQPSLVLDSQYASVLLQAAGGACHILASY